MRRPPYNIQSPVTEAISRLLMELKMIVCDTSKARNFPSLARFAVALTTAFFTAAVVATRYKLTRHSDGKLGVHCWPEAEPLGFVKVYREGATKDSAEACLRLYLLGYEIEVWHLDPKASAQAVLSRAMRAR